VTLENDIRYRRDTGWEGSWWWRFEGGSEVVICLLVVVVVVDCSSLRNWWGMWAGNKADPLTCGYSRRVCTRLGADTESGGTKRAAWLGSNVNSSTASTWKFHPHLSQDTASLPFRCLSCAGLSHDEKDDQSHRRGRHARRRPRTSAGRLTSMSSTDKIGAWRDRTNLYILPSPQQLRYH